MLRPRACFPSPTGSAHFSGNYIYTVADDSLVVRLDFADIRPARWAEAAPSLAGLAALDVPFSGEVVAVIDGTRLTLRDATWDVSLGAGQIKHNVFENGALALAGARMQGGIRSSASAAQYRLADAAARAMARSARRARSMASAASCYPDTKPAALDLHLTLAAEALKVDDFPALWPDNANADTRSWVTQHVRDGTIDQLQAQLGLHVDLTPGAAQAVRVDQFEGNFTFSGLSVEYFRPLPPALNVNGTAHFDRTQIAFTATNGEVGAIKASAATARFYQLDTHNEQAKIDVTAAGPLADTLALLDMPPFYYARDMGIDPKRAGR